MSTEGHRAVSRALRRILEERYPGTVWTPLEPEEAEAAKRAGRAVVSLSDLWGLNAEEVGSEKADDR